MKKILALIVALTICSFAGASAAMQQITIVGEGSTIASGMPAGCTAVHQSEVVCKSERPLSTTVVFSTKVHNVVHLCDVIVTLHAKFGVKATRGSGLCYTRQIRSGVFGVGYQDVIPR
ncbi:MAG: hypothetical protein KGN02_15210 [bacterium]|nr:hypothetical protein [bacterium]